jgi:2-iminobutanoate/2-iminopropanoate deaminase
MHSTVRPCWELTLNALKQRQVLKNLAAVLEEAGSGFANAVKVNIFLTDMRDFAAMNEAWDEVFTGPVKPVSRRYDH